MNWEMRLKAEGAAAVIFRTTEVYLESEMDRIEDGGPTNLTLELNNVLLA